jgi:hypothetical protein
MWKDPLSGEIVTKKPHLSSDAQKPQAPELPQSENILHSLPDFLPYIHQVDGAPISPPTSNNSLTNTWDDHESGISSGYPVINLDPSNLSFSDSCSPIDQRFWSTNLNQPQPEPFTATVFDDAPFDDIFNPDTASSFNNPFTTMSNYNWLFNMNLSRDDQVQQPVTQDSFAAFPSTSNAVTQSNHAFDLQLEQITINQSMPVAGHNDSPASQHTHSPQQSSPAAPLISPPLDEEPQRTMHDIVRQIQKPHIIARPRKRTPLPIITSEMLMDIERPMSMLVPSTNLPIIDEMARAQLLDLIDIIQPTAPDGSIVMRDHPLLTMSCMQTYCDLFFTRFNTAYPLVHMSTFDPSEVDTLLLISVLLLGATYGEKDAHQLAVCRASLESSCPLTDNRCVSTMYFDRKFSPTQASLRNQNFGFCKLFCSSSASARAELDRSSTTCLISSMVCLSTSSDAATVKVFAHPLWRMLPMTLKTTGETGVTQNKRRD